MGLVFYCVASYFFPPNYFILKNCWLVFVFQKVYKGIKRYNEGPWVPENLFCCFFFSLLFIVSIFSKFASTCSLLRLQWNLLSS